jgi:hypothetical protein
MHGSGKGEDKRAFYCLTFQEVTVRLYICEDGGTMYSNEVGENRLDGELGETGDSTLRESCRRQTRVAQRLVVDIGRVRINNLI